MLDIENVLDQLDLMESKMTWAREEINDSIKKLMDDLHKYSEIEQEFNRLSEKTRRWAN